MENWLSPAPVPPLPTPSPVNKKYQPYKLVFKDSITNSQSEQCFGKNSSLQQNLPPALFRCTTVAD